MKQRIAIQAELDKVAARHNGLLRPKDVLAFARDTTTALHGCFEWNDGKAAQNYRLWQARELIQVYVTVIDAKLDPIRAFVSLTADRQKDGGGYRRLDVVLQDKVLRQNLLNEALAELERFREKYAQLKELAAVFAAIGRLSHKKRAVA